MVKSPSSIPDDDAAARRAAADPVDVHVGRRLRLRRASLGMSQDRLGEAIGLTFQQIQKYERGINRIAAGRLYEIGHVLGVPVAFFFEEMPASGGIGARSPLREAVALAKPEVVELAQAFDHIGDERVRRRLLDLVKAISGPLPA
jgi:transcriptional regulator with XRE-family HTH domain